MNSAGVEIIEIRWDGPYNLDKAVTLNGPNDYGLYQIYGSHNIHGHDTLLYLGQVYDRTFGKRFKNHKEWMELEASPLDIYIGRLGGIKNITYHKLTEKIKYAEATLLYFANPVYNKRDEKVNKLKGKVIVLNFLKCNRLPLVVSNVWINSTHWTDEWKLYAASDRKEKKKKLNLY